MTDARPVLVAIRQLLVGAQSLLDELLAGGGASAPAAHAPRRPRAADVRSPESSRDEDGAAPTSAGPSAAGRRRRNPAAGRAAKARWAAMSPEERAERVRKMQAARKRS